MPITQGVYRMLYEGLPVQQVLQELMESPSSEENNI